MMKSNIKLLLQKILGFNTFLFLFSIFTIRRLKANKHEAEFQHFLSLLPTDHALLDIGANIGIMTVPLAQKARNGKVYAFEPMPQNLKALKRIIKFFGLKNVTVFDHALGNETGEVTMVMPVENMVKMQGLSHVAQTDSAVKGDRISVPVKKLDDITELKNAPAIGGIKIDVENFEYEVFTGAKDLLKKHKPFIYCELWNNPKRQATLSFLKDEIGYNIKVFDGDKLIPFTGRQSAANFFLVP